MDVVPGCSANCLFTARECVRHDVVPGHCEDCVPDLVMLQGVVISNMSHCSLQELVCNYAQFPEWCHKHNKVESLIIES